MQLDLSFAYDDVEVGFKSGRSRGRTATEADVVNFMMLTGNWVEIHSNVEFCKTTPFGQRLVQGSLVLAMSQGLWSPGRSVAAFYGLDGVRFVKPVFINDTIYLECEVIKKRDKDEKFGVVTWQMNVTNQRRELVQKAEYSLLTYKVLPEH